MNYGEHAPICKCSLKVVWFSMDNFWISYPDVQKSSSHPEYKSYVTTSEPNILAYHERNPDFDYKAIITNPLSLANVSSDIKKIVITFIDEQYAGDSFDEFLAGGGLTGTHPRQHEQLVQLRTRLDSFKKQTLQVDDSLKTVPTINHFSVKHWIDCSDNFGFAYILSNGSLGILFNNTTKFVKSADEK